MYISAPVSPWWKIILPAAKLRRLQRAGKFFQVLIGQSLEQGNGPQERRRVQDGGGAGGGNRRRGGAGYLLVLDRHRRQLGIQHPADVAVLVLDFPPHASLPPSGYSIIPLSILRTVPELLEGERLSSKFAVAMKLWRGAVA